MNVIHALLDTKKKRELLFCGFLFGLMIVECFWNSAFLWRVSQIDRLEALYDLMDLASYGTIGRLLLSFFEASNLQFVSIGKSILSHLNIRFVLLVWLGAYVMVVRAPSSVCKVSKRIFWIIFIIQLLSFAIMSGYVIINVRYTTYGTVLRQLHLLASFLFVTQSISGIISVLAVIYLGYQMVLAMEYRAVEVTEDVSIAFRVVSEEKEIE